MQFRSCSQTFCFRTSTIYKFVFAFLPRLWGMRFMEGVFLQDTAWHLTVQYEVLSWKNIQKEHSSWAASSFRCTTSSTTMGRRNCHIRFQFHVHKDLGYQMTRFRVSLLVDPWLTLQLAASATWQKINRVEQTGCVFSGPLDGCYIRSWFRTQTWLVVVVDFVSLIDEWNENGSSSSKHSYY